MSQDILVTLIDPDPDQPRRHFDMAAIDELAQSIASDGLASPILVRPVGERYVIVYGERRWRAVRSLGWATIPADVREMTPAEAHWLALAENIQRADLTPTEEAEAYQRILADGTTQTELAGRLGKTQSYIAQKLRLLTLPSAVRLYIAGGVLTEGHARQLLTLRALYGELEARFVVTQGEDETTWDWPAAFALLRDIRPEDNPVCWFAKANGPSTAAIIEGCAELGRCIDAAGGVLPQWEVAAFWWASLAVYEGASVADLLKALHLWEGRFVSALTNCLMFPERPEASGGELETMLYYGYQSDVRHSSALAWVDRSAERPERIQEGIWDMLDENHLNHMPLPSALQPWGFQHERYMKLTEDRRW